MPVIVSGVRPSFNGVLRSQPVRFGEAAIAKNLPLKAEIEEMLRNTHGGEANVSLRGLQAVGYIQLGSGHHASIDPVTKAAQGFFDKKKDITPLFLQHGFIRGVSSGSESKLMVFPLFALAQYVISGDMGYPPAPSGPHKDMQQVDISALAQQYPEFAKLFMQDATTLKNSLDMVIAGLQEEIQNSFWQPRKLALALSQAMCVTLKKEIASSQPGFLKRLLGSRLSQKSGNSVPPTRKIVFITT